jgi:hypothetical protein
MDFWWHMQPPELAWMVIGPVANRAGPAPMIGVMAQLVLITVNTGQRGRFAHM